MTLIRSSYQTGYATCAAESAHPHLWNGLVGAWIPALGVTGSTLFDVSGYKAHGAITSATWNTRIGLEGAGQSITPVGGITVLDFDGGNDYVRIKEAPQHDITNKLSITVWYTNTGAGTDEYLFAKRDGAASTGQYGFFHDTGTLLWGTIWNTDANCRGSQRSTSDMITSTFTMGGTDQGAIWSEGAVTTTDNTVDAITTATSDLFIGARGNGAGGAQGFYGGMIAAVLLHNVVLSDNQIRQLHRNPLAPFQLSRKNRKFRPSAAPAGLSIPIAAYHYNHSLGSNG